MRDTEYEVRLHSDVKGNIARIAHQLIGSQLPYEIANVDLHLTMKERGGKD